MSFEISLAAARVNAEMTQIEWAEALKVTKKTIINWEKGKTSPSAEKLREISGLSGIPMDYIFVGKKSTEGIDNNTVSV